MTRSATSDRRDRSKRALARSAVYRFLSELSLSTGSEVATGQRSYEADERRAELESACAVLAEAGYNAAALGSIADLSSAFSAANATRLTREYVRVFGHTVSKECPPYETQYGVPHLFEQTRALADLAGFYRAFGLEVRPRAGERLDHLAIELEFMHVLTYKEAYALENHGATRADLCREAQEKFLGEHLGTWFDDFAARLSERGGTGPYALYAEALRGYLADELTYLSLSPVQQKKLRPQPELSEPPSCGVSCRTLSRLPSSPEAG